MKTLHTFNTQNNDANKENMEKYFNLNTTKNILILGTAGSGKTYFAQNVAKELHLLGVEIIVIDSTGAYDALAKLRGKKTYKVSEENPLNIFLPYTDSLVPRNDVLDNLGKELVIFDVSLFTQDMQKAGISYFLMTQICRYVGLNTEKEKMIIIDGADFMGDNQEIAEHFLTTVERAKEYNLNIIATIKNVETFLQKDFGKKIVQTVDNITLFQQTPKSSQLLAEALPLESNTVKELCDLSVGKHYAIILGGK